MIRSLIGTAVLVFGAMISPDNLLAAGDGERGRNVTEKWCVVCHAVAGARKPTAPAFTVIVRRPGRDDAYLSGFLEDDHFPMMMHGLAERDKEDVLAYFRSLRRRR